MSESPCSDGTWRAGQPEGGYTTFPTAGFVTEPSQSHCSRCEAFDAALHRLNSLYRGEAQEPSTKELAKKVRPFLAHHPYDAARKADAALSELVVRAQGHVPVEALAASEADRAYWMERELEAQAAREQAEKERDEWKEQALEGYDENVARGRKLQKAEADRDRLTAALEQIATMGTVFDAKGTQSARVREIALKALTP